MSMLEYIRQIKIKFRDQYKFKPARTEGTEPVFAVGQIPDGEYPMKIDGKLDKVKVINGAINCCNFD